MDPTSPIFNSKMLLAENQADPTLSLLHHQLPFLFLISISLPFFLFYIFLVIYMYYFIWVWVYKIIIKYNNNKNDYRGQLQIYWNKCQTKVDIINT